MVVLCQQCQLHQSAMHHQEYQHIRRPMPGIIELLLLDGPWDRSADRVTLQDLEGRDLIHTHHPDALVGKPIRISIAPKDLLRSFFEPGIQTGGLPIAGAMGLQIDIVQQTANRCRTDRADDAVLHSLASEVLAGPIGDVQALGNGFQTGQFNNLRSLHRCDLFQSPRTTFTPVGQQPFQAILTIAFTGTPYRRYTAFHLSGDITLTLTGSESQHYPGPTHLMPGQAVAMSGGAQTTEVCRGKG